MAIVVEQTLPFPASSLNLENSDRWNTLFPLIRPSVKAIQAPEGVSLLVDQNLAAKSQPHIVAIGNPGNLSSRLLDDKHVSAIITRAPDSAHVALENVPKALHIAGVKVESGIVIVKAGKSRKLEQQDTNVVVLETKGELEQDHVLRLLGDASATTRGNIAEIAELLRIFEKTATSTQSKFNTEKIEGNPVVLHADGSKGFDKARHAIERDIKLALQLQSSPSEPVVYSVHYADINGLSRLENYILAGEIAQYLDSQDLIHRLSHSTILDHAELARGWGVSILAVPSKFLTLPIKPVRHRPTSALGDASLKKALAAPSTSRIQFNDADVRQRIEKGCSAVIKEEPTITEYDTIVGDGDCGYTLRDGAKKVLSFISCRDLSKLPQTVAELVSELEVNMGGTSGALYCIYLTALASSLATSDSVPEALKTALDQLTKYTKARVGDRTMMDTLIPFIDTLVTTDCDVVKALQKAKIGVEGTKKMEAKLGRSTYLDESATRGVPDPGAYGLFILFQGLCLA